MGGGALRERCWYRQGARRRGAWAQEARGASRVYTAKMLRTSAWVAAAAAPREGRAGRMVRAVVSAGGLVEADSRTRRMWGWPAVGNVWGAQRR